MATEYKNLFKSRNIILSLLKRRGYNIEQYDGTSISEIEILHKNDTLDMLLSNDNGKQILVKYLIKQKIKPKTVFNTVEDVYNIDNILKKDDELIIITKHKINMSMMITLETLYREDNIFVNVYNIKDYLFNILEHTLVPKHEKLDDDEKSKIMKLYNINKESEFPEISRFDPVAQAIGLKPNQLCEITRKSETAINAKYYRLCC